MNLLQRSYKNKKVLITGDTGFKGSWLCIWLKMLGAEVYGLSNGVPSNPSMFENLNLNSHIYHSNLDIRNFDNLKDLINTIKPDFIFHLAAQAIVSTAFNNPVETFTTNVIGTMNLLETLRILDIQCNVIIITSDKCYDNVEWIWGYKETDSLGGKDIYSGSKGAAELVIKSYYHSYFQSQNSPVRIAVGRAGNVIGGGDWANDRIIPDCMRSWSDNKIVEIRSPNSTRPWQHVLEPLSGYLNLGAELQERAELNGECFNFGPQAEYSKNVKTLIEDLSIYWKYNNPNDAYVITFENKFHEASLLKLNCDKALSYLNWVASLNYNQLLNFTGEWYYNFYKSDLDMFDFTQAQINTYTSIAFEKNIRWAV